MNIRIPLIVIRPLTAARRLVRQCLREQPELPEQTGMTRDALEKELEPGAEALLKLGESPHAPPRSVTWGSYSSYGTRKWGIR